LSWVVPSCDEGMPCARTAPRINPDHESSPFSLLAREMAPEERLGSGAVSREPAAALSRASTDLRPGRDEAALSDSELVRELQRRVATLEQTSRGQTPRREVVVRARTVMEILGMVLGVVAVVGVVSVASG